MNNLYICSRDNSNCNFLQSTNSVLSILHESARNSFFLCAQSYSKDRCFILPPTSSLSIKLLLLLFTRLVRKLHIQCYCATSFYDDFLIQQWVRAIFLPRVLHVVASEIHTQNKPLFSHKLVNDYQRRSGFCYIMANRCVWRRGGRLCQQRRPVSIEFSYCPSRYSQWAFAFASRTGHSVNSLLLASRWYGSLVVM